MVRAVPQLRRLHRLLGLVLALPLFLMAVSGLVLVMAQQLDAVLNPDWLRPATPRDAAGRPAPPLPPLQLHARIAEAVPTGGRVRRLRLDARSGEGVRVLIGAMPNGPGRAELPFNEMFVDPVSGERLGARRWGATAWDRRTVVGWVHRLHSSLTLPFRTGRLWLAGLALLWLAHTATGLLMAVRARGPAAKRPGWRSSHRALALFAGALLLAWAWSAVLLTARDELWRPVMATVVDFGVRPAAVPARLAPRALVDADGRPDWAAALAQARAAVATLAVGTAWQEVALSWQEERGVFVHEGRSAGDLHTRRALSTVTLDAHTGQILGLDLPGQRSPGARFAEALGAMHRGELGAVAGMTLAVACTAATLGLVWSGLVLWLRRRRADRAASRFAWRRVPGQA